MGERPWHAAWQDAVYGGRGFYLRERPADHFRTSVTTSPAFAAALRRLAGRVDDALGRPDPFDLVDLGAGSGELLQALPDVPARWRLTAVELRPDPALAGVRWLPRLPALRGLLVAHEWLDDVPLDVVEHGRVVLVDDAGRERLGSPAPAEQVAWARRWWPDGDRVEVGLSRDRAWAAAVRRVRRGVALAVDYAHVLRPPAGPPARTAEADASGRPSGRPPERPRRTPAEADAAPFPRRRLTLAGYRDGRQVRPVPDGSCDLTAWVAADAVAAATGSRLLDQRTALRRLGVRAALPAWGGDARRYATALQAATSAATLLDPAGLGGFAWLVRPVGVADPLAATIRP